MSFEMPGPRQWRDTNYKPGPALGPFLSEELRRRRALGRMHKVDRKLGLVRTMLEHPEVGNSFDAAAGYAAQAAVALDSILELLRPHTEEVERDEHTDDEDGPAGD